jgi:hypothetical protein
VLWSGVLHLKASGPRSCWRLSSAQESWATVWPEAMSPDLKPSQVRPEAIAVMRELDIDISGQRSKSVEEFTGQEFRLRSDCL